MKGGIEWVKISLYGQSFILHQVRTALAIPRRLVEATAAL